MIDGIVAVQEGARRPMNTGVYYFNDSTHLVINLDSKVDHGSSSCTCIHFRNANFANINWMGLWIKLTWLIVLCVASCVMKTLDEIAKATCRGLSNLGKDML